MKCILSLFSLALFITSCKPVELIPGKDVYFGKPKIIISSSYYGTGKVEESPLKSIDEYDIKGNLIQATLVGKNTSVRKYQYDRHGRMVKLSFFIGKDSLIGITNKRYNSKGNIINESRWWRDSKANDVKEFSYYNNGKLKQEYSFKQGELFYKSFYKYLHKKKQLMTSFNPDNTKQSIITKTRLPRNMILTLVQAGNGDTTSLYLSKFDKFGRIISEEHLYPKTRISYSSVIRLLDHKNNSIADTVRSSNGYVHIEHRTISYW
jgi:antitoxin component YwqK of YwqJK toxin-antitoxin module